MVRLCLTHVYTLLTELMEAAHVCCMFATGSECVVLLGWSTPRNWYAHNIIFTTLAHRLIMFAQKPANSFSPTSPSLAPSLRFLDKQGLVILACF